MGELSPFHSPATPPIDIEDMQKAGPPTEASRGRRGPERLRRRPRENDGDKQEDEGRRLNARSREHKTVSYAEEQLPMRAPHKTYEKLSPFRANQPAHTKSNAHKPGVLKSADHWPAFKHSFMVYAELENIPQDRIVPTLFSYFDPSILERVRALNLSNQEVASPDEAFSKLDKLLCPGKSVLANRLDLNILEQDGESIPEFATTIRLKAQNCDFSNTEAGDLMRNNMMLQTFLKGVDDDVISLDLLKREPPLEDFEEAVALATNIETARNTRKRRSHRHQMDNTLCAIRESYADAKKSTQELIDSLTKQNAELKTELENLRAAGYRKPVCFRCGNPGHVRRECAAVLNPDQTARSDPRQGNWGASRRNARSQYRPPRPRETTGPTSGSARAAAVN